MVVGARPNFVKVGPLLPELERAGHEVEVAFTGSRESERRTDGAEGEVTFWGVAVPSPKWFLDIGEGAAGVQTGRALIALEELFATEVPDAVLIVGDVNSTLASAIAAAKLHIPIVHLEAGLRCGQMGCPEEVNRVLISRVTSLHLAPTESAMTALEKECVPSPNISFVGNIMAESVLKHLDEIKRLDAAAAFGLAKQKYILCVIRREENVDDRNRLSGVVSALAQMDLPVLIPDAEGFRAALDEYQIDVPENVTIVDAVGYREMLALQRDAAAIVTDSGGIQEEACMVGTPCVTVRPVTEHVATLEVGANRLSEPTPAALTAAVAAARSDERTWVTPKRWDKAVSGRIVRALRKSLEPLT